MQAQVSVLRAQVAGLKGELAERPAASEPAAEDQPALDERRAEGERNHAAHMAKIEDAFAREVVDPTWSSKTSSRVWTAINEMDVLRTAAREVECRSRTCRIEVSDDGTGELHKQLPLFAQQFADAMPRMSGKQVTDESGKAGMVLYLMSRESTQAVPLKN